ncbi:MAG: 2-C-methyl-D-erythritol 4-phosphate cytidylyltransferase [Synergistaceae bacterium]|nr:2-C-methyl-D-erythritol 4-phosphate cytidylyltransferase [Synergistaceae bacterium]
MNIVCILAGGSGNRFGSPVPKQYHLINGRPVIEYVIDAAVKSIADEVIIAADRDNIARLTDTYGVIAVEGGSTRNDSIARLLDYIAGHYECGKIILAEAVCPLLTCELLDKYFALLDEYDAVFTASDITTNLARYDGKFADRDEFFLIESPDAYRFEILRTYFDAEAKYSTPLYSLPEGTRIKFCRDFRDYIKIIHPHDLAAAEALMHERRKHIHFEAHSDDTALALFAKLRRIDRAGTRIWEKRIDYDIDALFAQWEVYNFSVNINSYTGLVLECRSRKFGECVIKIYPEFARRRYTREVFVLSALKNYCQAEILDCDSQRRAILTSRVIPGDYADFSTDRQKLSEMFTVLQASRLKLQDIPENPEEITGVLDMAGREYTSARKCSYYPEMMSYLLENARKVYDEYFASQPKYLLHGNIYRRNALRSENGIVLINPFGYADAYEFEYMPFITGELAVCSESSECLDVFRELVKFFAGFADTERFGAAAFVFLVRQLIPSVYEANDNFRRADRYLEVIRALYLDENNNFILNKYETN